MGMSRKQVDCGRIIANIKAHTVRHPSKMPVAYQGSPSTKSLNKSDSSHVQRVSPLKGPHFTSERSSRASFSPTSSGLLAGHYAGCKFSEPPLPSALPLPPKHWMQTTRSARLQFHSAKSDHSDVNQQLKMLLKGQA